MATSEYTYSDLNKIAKEEFNRHIKPEYAKAKFEGSFIRVHNNGCRLVIGYSWERYTGTRDNNGEYTYAL